MTIDTYPRLCGGTFFTLVLQALRQRMNAREHYDGDCDGLSDPEVLAGLLKVINPDYQNPGKEKLKGMANNYKACKTSTSVYLPFDDEQVISTFDDTVRTSYRCALNGMISFVNTFIDLSKVVRKDVRLVRALVDLIQQDRSVGADEVLYIGPNGEKKKKAALGDLEDVCLPSFLLGVWHYVVTNRKDNSIGKDTYDIWCPSNGRGPRKYMAHMGDSVLREIHVYSLDHEYNSIADDIETQSVDTEIVDDIPESQSVQQTVNNPFVFNFTQHGNNNTQIGHVEHYHAGEKED